MGWFGPDGPCSCDCGNCCCPCTFEWDGTDWISIPAYDTCVTPGPGVPVCQCAPGTPGPTYEGEEIGEIAITDCQTGEGGGPPP